MRSLVAALLAVLLFVPLARQARAAEAAPAPASATASTTASPPAATAPSQPAAPSQASPPAEPEMSPQDKADYEAGKKAAEEIEKELKVIENQPDLPRLNTIVERLRPCTEKPNQRYTVKVVKEPAINAFSLPGGFIYFTEGLLKAAESDDELAAVAAHEMAHVSLNHSRRLQDKDAQFNKILGGVILGAVLGQSSGIDPGKVAAMGAFVKMDRVNHYGRAAELEADAAAVRYLQASKSYNPVAMLTVVEGLAQMDAAGPKVDMGALQTHPLATERVEAVKKELAARHIAADVRRVTKGLTATAAAATKEGREIGDLRLKLDDKEYPLFQPAAEVEGVSPLARAQRSAEVLNQQLLASLSVLDVSSTTQGGSVVFQARGKTLFTITPADATFHKTTVEALAAQATQGFQFGFYAERTKRAF